MSTGERGETLLELVVAVTIMGLAVAAIVGGMATSIMMSDIHRQEARAGAAARDYAEAAVTWVTAGHYDAGTNPAYDPATVQYTAPSGYRASAVSVSGWDGAGWKPCAQAQKGLEQLTVQVYDGTDASKAKAVEKVVVVLREPSCQVEAKPCS